MTDRVMGRLGRCGLFDLGLWGLDWGLMGPIMGLVMGLAAGLEAGGDRSSAR